MSGLFVVLGWVDCRWKGRWQWNELDIEKLESSNRPTRVGLLISSSRTIYDMYSVYTIFGAHYQ